MDIKDFKAGTFRKGYRYQYFLPEGVNHAFFWTDEGLNELLEEASLRLGELRAFSRLVPSADLFIKKPPGSSGRPRTGLAAPASPTRPSSPPPMRICRN